MSEDEIVKVVEEKISLSAILRYRDITVNMINDLITSKVLKEEKGYDRDTVLTFYGYLECLFKLHLIEQDYFMKSTKALSDLLKENESNE